MKIGDIVQCIIDKYPNIELTVSPIPNGRAHFNLRYTLYERTLKLYDVKQLPIGAYGINSEVEFEQTYLDYVYIKMVATTFLCDVEDVAQKAEK